MCSIVSFVCVCAETPTENQGWDEDEFVGSPFLLFLSILLTSLTYLEFGCRVVNAVGVHFSVFDVPCQDEEEFDDDYESPYSADDAESVEDYESPNDDMANDYEPPPSQPSEELKVAPSVPIGDSDYIGNHKPLHASMYAFGEIINTWLEDRIMH